MAAGLLALFVSVVIVSKLRGASITLAGVIVWFLAALGVAVVGLALCGAAAWAVEVIAARRLRRVEWRMGPMLREWLNVEDLDEDELRQWRQCERRGVTVGEARRWANLGLPYPLLVAAPGLTVEDGSVRALARVMEAAGVWDGHDRRELVDLIGFHVDIPGGTYPVLGRWLALPLETVRDRVSTAVARADIDEAVIVPDHRPAWAARSVLYRLEDEYGIKGYRARPQRPVHPSWLVSVA